MQFEWDEQKNQANIRRRGLDFADAAQVFDGPMIVNLDTRQDYEEDRWIGIGMTHGRGCRDSVRRTRRHDPHNLYAKGTET